VQTAGCQLTVGDRLERQRCGEKKDEWQERTALRLCKRTGRPQSDGGGGFYRSEGILAVEQLAATGEKKKKRTGPPDVGGSKKDAASPSI